MPSALAILEVASKLMGMTNLKLMWLFWGHMQQQTTAVLQSCQPEACNMQFTAGDHLAYVDDVLDRAFDGQALRAALGQTRASTSAAETVLQLTRAAGSKGAHSSHFKA